MDVRGGDHTTPGRGLPDGEGTDAAPRSIFISLAQHQASNATGERGHGAVGVEGDSGGGPDVGGPLMPSHARLADLIVDQRNGIRRAIELLEMVLPLATETSPTMRRQIIHGLFELESYL